MSALPAGRGRRSAVWGGVFLGLTLILTWPLLRQINSAIPGDAFDGWQNFWNLWWVRKALLELHTHPYFTTELYHPAGVTLWFQTINIFNGLASLPLQLAGGLYLAYNGVVIFSFAAAGLGAALLAVYVLRRAGVQRGRGLGAAAILAGCIFTFSPFHFAHLLGHMQVFSLQFVPFYVLYLLRALEPGALRWRDAGRAGFFLLLAGLCDWYFVLYLGFFTALLCLWLLIGRRLRRAQFAALGLIAAIFLVGAGPLLAPMVVESLRYDFMRPPPGQIAALSADALAFVLPSIQHPLWGEWAARLRAPLSASPSENTLYLGAIPTFLAVWGAARRRTRLGFWLAAALLFLLFAMGPVLHVGGESVHLPNGSPFPLPYALLLRLPFIEIARTVARYGLLVMLCLSVLAARGMADLLAAPGRGWLGMLLAGLTLFEFAALPYPMSPPDTPAWYQTLASDPRPGAVLNLPMNWDRPNYLLFQTVHNKPLTAGYISRDDPRTYPTRLPLLSDFRRNAPDINALDPALFAPTLFAFLDIGWVVIDRYQMPDGAERQATDALTAAIFAGRAPLYADDRITVYETWPPEVSLPFIELGADWGEWQAGPQRLLSQSATLIVHSPDKISQELVVTPAAGDPSSLRLTDAAGDTIPALAAGRWRVPLLSGANTFTLSAETPLAIQRVEIPNITTSSPYHFITRQIAAITPQEHLHDR